MSPSTIGVTQPGLTEETPVASMKLYEYKVGNVTHTAQMSEDDADRLGAKEVKAAKAPTTKARQAPANKAAG
ncbi:hypothetical protein PBI_MAHDIA_6 [Gordonia phage Mahdia]|uniref:Uncharacterized protein n=1 Tax=Gordonia phage Mahdia TaxID=2047873 RepID=A0A2H4P9U9_9CAUD|nr:hypothetical protein FDJ14_gp06 [Gordonia phage Mahdia]ATW59005.1 hypothetical protein PBI_MAHDIA_6 [Gordonia phage Mahdia]